VITTRKSTQAALWGGGFAEPMHPALAALSNSLAQDLPLADADLRASAVYARALARAGVLTDSESAELFAALEAMRADLAAGRWVPRDAEDIHAAIETELVRRIGQPGESLHTGRSRNDQVATAFRLAVRERAAALIGGVCEVASALLGRAEREVETLLPAYTHLQRAQPVRLAHWLLAHFWPLARDAERLTAAGDRAAVLPLGSGAAIGHAFGLDREWIAAELGFRAVSPNSLDAVGDRDFAVELVFACALLAVHLSRLAEELVIWSSAEFGFVHWPDALATGSSLMPNKKNADLVELVRGRAAASIGDLTALLVLLKGMPSSYQRDLQEDKLPVWRVTQATEISLAAMAAALEGIVFDRERMRAALTDELLATEVADAMVARGIPFRTAHRAVAEAVAATRRVGCGLRELALAPDAELPSPLVPADLAGLDFEAAVERRTAAGGTARRAVLEQIEQARAVLERSAW
jgi:argininosuccinate lyase